MVIDDGVGSSVRERVTALNCDSTQCNYTYYPAVGSRAEFGVSVEVAGCVTDSTVCLERPVCELAAKILGRLFSEQVWEWYAVVMHICCSSALLKMCHPYNIVPPIFH